MSEASGTVFSAEQIKIPADLPQIMKDYTKHIIKTQPQDLIAASAEWVFVCADFWLFRFD
jgi:hypothetical protein